MPCMPRARISEDPLPRTPHEAHMAMQRTQHAQPEPDGTTTRRDEGANEGEGTTQRQSPGGEADDQERTSGATSGARPSEQKKVDAWREIDVRLLPKEQRPTAFRLLESEHSAGCERQGIHKGTDNDMTSSCSMCQLTKESWGSARPTNVQNEFP